MDDFAWGLAGRCPGVYYEKDIWKELGVEVSMTPTHLPEQDAWVIAQRMWQCCKIAEERQKAALMAG